MLPGNVIVAVEKDCRKFKVCDDAGYCRFYECPYPLEYNPMILSCDRAPFFRLDCDRLVKSEM